MQTSLFSQPESPEEKGNTLSPTCSEVEQTRGAAPRWGFGRINKKKGRHIWLQKGHPGAGVVCIAYSLAK